jgi:hypothetical protein
MRGRGRGRGRVSADDYPIGLAPETVDFRVEMARKVWGTPDAVAALFPSRADDPEFRQWAAKVIRAFATPKNMAAQLRYFIENLDAREALPLIRVPTLVLHSKNNLDFSIEEGRYLADHVTGARFVELPGGDGAVANSVDGIEAIVEFVTGERPEVAVDRILTTLLFTDIVGSTGPAASMGDQAWRSLLDAHDRTVRDHLRRFRGREINATGDGFLASFDGPARAIRCALAIGEATQQYRVDLHLGLRTGECDVRGDDLGGLAVHIAARIGPWRHRAKCSSHPRSRTWSPARGSTWWTGESTNSKGCRNPGGCIGRCRDGHPETHHNRSADGTHLAYRLSAASNPTGPGAC